MLKLVINPETCDGICIRENGDCCPNMENPDSPCFIPYEDRKEKD